jgi:hypothetical protein
MLLDFPLDCWNMDHIKGAIKDFGVLVAWDEEASSYAAIIIKVRVVSLDKIPHSCVVSDGDNFQAESWSVPIYILSQNLVGNLPVHEDIPPEDGSTPHPLPIVPFNPVHAAPQAGVPPINVGNGWQPWQMNNVAMDLDFAALDHDPPVNLAGQNLNVIFPPAGAAAPLINGFDLNAPPDFLEDGFLEVNDLVDPTADAQDLPHDQQPDIAQPGDSSVTLIVSSDSANSSDGSVNGLQPNGNLFV